MRFTPLGAATLLAAASALAQTSSKTPITFEWVFGDSGRRVATLPQTAWRSDGTLLYYDSRMPPERRTLEIIDPASGSRRPAVNTDAALASLNALLPRDERQRSLAWPQSFDASGRHALYVLDGDLFVLDLRASAFTRLTVTPQEEHSAEF